MKRRAFFGSATSGATFITFLTTLGSAVLAYVKPEPVAWPDRLARMDREELERTLIQCVATISTTPRHCEKTPDEIFGEQVKLAREIRDAVR